MSCVRLTATVASCYHDATKSTRCKRMQANFMDDVVPSALQRLRAADIIRVAGLAIASLGQEYCRIGAVHTTMRRGSQLLGIVDISNLANGSTASQANTV